MPPDEETGEAYNPQEAERPVNPELHNAMVEAMKKLDAKNQELGGKLFGTFGNSESTALIFNTPIEDTTDDTGPRSEFLIATVDGFKILRIGQLISEQKQNIINRISEAIKGSQEQPGAYRMNQMGWMGTHLELGGDLSVSRVGAVDRTQQIPPETAVILDDIVPDRAEMMIRDNIQRANVDRQRAERFVKPSIAIVDRLDEILS